MVRPRDAATLMLIQDTFKGVEALMVQRDTKNNFAGGAHVFPGGMVDVADYQLQVEKICSGITFHLAKDIIKDLSPGMALGAFVAAIRETFEETRILLAHQKSERLITFNKKSEIRFAKYRKQLLKGVISFGEIIQREGLLLATDRIFYFSPTVFS